MERPCHVEGMLHRDQRTAKLRFFDDSDAEQVPKTYAVREKTPRTCFRCAAKSSRSPGANSFLSCRNGYLLNTFQSVQNVLLLVCITFIALPIVRTMPIDSSLEGKWMDPCGLRKGAIQLNATEPLSPSKPNATQLSHIATEATSAQENINSFIHKFLQDTYSKNIDEMRRDFEANLDDAQYKWLPQVVKSDGEATPDSHLEELKVEETLIRAHTILQKMAVGLEQVTSNLKDSQNDYAGKFDDTEHVLRRILCEVEQIIMEHGLVLPERESRDIISEHVRNNMDLSGQRIWNWTVIRQYLNILQYINEVFTHLSKEVDNST